MPKYRVGGLLFLLVTLLSACGGDSMTSTPSTATPTTPTSPTSLTTPTPLQITSATITPSMCISGLTTMQGHVVAQGTAGETLTYTWSSPQKGTFGTTPDVSFTCAGPDYQQSPFTPVTVAVIDSKGNSVKQSIAFTVADLRGSYSLVVGPLGTQQLRGITFFLSLKRKGSAITGTINDGNHYGTVDPAEAGTLDADGHFHIRFKHEYDFIISGQLVIDTNPQYGYSPGYYGIGYIQGGPNDGKPFVLRLEDPY